MTSDTPSRAALEESVREAKQLRNARRAEMQEAKARLQEAEDEYLEALRMLEDSWAEGTEAGSSGSAQRPSAGGDGYQGVLIRRGLMPQKVQSLG